MLKYTPEISEEAIGEIIRMEMDRQIVHITKIDRLKLKDLLGLHVQKSILEKSMKGKWRKTLAFSSCLV